MRWLNNFSIPFLAGLMVMAGTQSVNGQAAKVEPIRGVPYSSTVRPSNNQDTVASSYRRQEGDVAPADGWRKRTTTQPAGIAVGPSYGTTYFPRPAHSKLQSKIDAKLRQFASTSDNNQRKTIEEEIRTLLSEQFDERLKEPEQRVESSRRRLDELKSQIKNRVEKNCNKNKSHPFED